ncbi:MAG: adenylate/guanylate cyclase domain-containing protein [Acidimicrobiia bacterium]
MGTDARKFLRKRGTPADEIERAERDGWLPVLVVDRLLAPGKRKFTQEEVAERAGTDVATVRRLWRALGFPDFPSDLAAFTDHDVDALERALERAAGPMDLDALVDVVRIASVGLNRLAAAETDYIMASLTAMRDEGVDEVEVAGGLAELVDWDQMSALLDYGHRLLLRAALWRRLARGDAPRSETRDLAVGFVDLTGYTALSQKVSREELSELLDRFEGLAYDIVAENGGRFVKSIGDEVMYVSSSTQRALDIALSLVAGTVADDVIPPARAGLAYGAVLTRDGDYYGPVVNLANRLVSTAKPGGVHVSEGLHDVMHEVLEGDGPEADGPAAAGDDAAQRDDSRGDGAGGDTADGDAGATADEMPSGLTAAVQPPEQLEWRKLRRRRLRDIGLVPVWEVTRTPTGPADD